MDDALNSEQLQLTLLNRQGEGKLRADVHLPVFMNYGFYAQDYWGRLKQGMRELAQEVVARYDPAGVFRQRTGGWKP